MTNISAVGAQAAVTAPTKSITPDLNMFLKMLTTQLQHQDPLSPMDTAQYTQQLVQYSQVEQSLQQTSTLKEILAGLTGQGVAQATALVGRQVRVASDVAGLTPQSPATWSYKTSQTPATLVGTITDERGRVVDSIKIDPAADGTVSWNGTTAQGTAAQGAYRLSLSAKTASGADLPVTIQTNGTVKEVGQSNGSVMLGINGVDVPLTRLIAVSQLQD